MSQATKGVNESFVMSVERRNGAGALGALSTSHNVSSISTTGAASGTLGTADQGFMKVVCMVQDSGDFVLSCLINGNASTITFADLGDTICMSFVGTSWRIVSNNGCTVA